MAFLVILSILLAILGAYYYFKPRNPFETHGIPFKASFPVLGSLWEGVLTSKPLPIVIQEIYNLAPTFKYVGMFNKMTPTVMIRDPELIKSVAVRNFDHFRNHRNFSNEQTESFFSNNLLLLRDDRWKEVRAQVTPAFTSSKLKSMFQLMSETAVNVAKYLSALPPDQNEVEMKDIFTRYTNDVFATCAFGISVDSLADRENKFYMLGKEALNFHNTAIFRFLMLNLFPRLSRRLGITLLSKHVMNFFKQVVSDSIKMREEQGLVRPDFIQVMMEAKDKLGNELTVADITAQAFSFFFGGFETVSGLLCFAAHEIAANPQVQQRLHAEIDRVLNDSDSEVTFDQVNGLEYLDAVINETLRMYPIIPISDRECSKRFELPPAVPEMKPYVMQEGSHLWLPIYAIQRDPEYFEKPECFDPDRFLDKKSGILNSGAYLPFGMGPRLCIGNRFSLVEAKVALFHILARFRLEVCSKSTVPMKLKSRRMFLTAQNGFWLKVVARNDLIKSEAM